MVNSRLFAHDKNQLELRVGYPAAGDGDQDYQVETFLFFPRTLGITSDSYTRDTFYRDTGAFVRLSTPQATLEELGPHGRALVYDELEEALREDPDAAVRRIKVLGCVLKSSLKREVKVALQGGGDPEALLPLADRIEGAMMRFESHAQPDPTLAMPLRNAWAACDEFVSLEAESACTRVVQCQPEGLVRERFAALAVACYTHRRGRGFQSIVEPGAENEALLLKHRRAKRAMYSVLYLEALRHEPGRLWSNLAGMIAAAVAMFFAVLTTLWATQRFEMASTAFVTIAVVSYVVKDRIKDLGRALIGERLASQSPDHEIAVRDHELNQRVGTLRETFRIADPDDIDPLVMAERLRHHDSALAADARPETVVCWRKQMKLDAGALSEHPLGVAGLTDIVRFNFERLRARMGPAYVDRVVVDPATHELLTIRCASVHHVNVLVRLTGPDGPTRIEGVRVVLDQRGIKRVERLD